MSVARPQQVLWRFRGYGKPYLRLLSFGFGLRICEMAADLATPWPVAVVIDRVLGAKAARNPLTSVLEGLGASKTAMLTAAAASVLLVALISAGFDYAGDRVMNV